MAMVDELKVKLAQRRKIVEPGRTSNLQQLKLFTSPDSQTQGLAWEPGRIVPKVTDVEALDGDLEADIQRLRLSSPGSHGPPVMGRSSSCTAIGKIGNAIKTGVSGKEKRKVLQQQLADMTAERDAAFGQNRRLNDELRDADREIETLRGEIETLQGLSPSETVTTTSATAGSDAMLPGLGQEESSAPVDTPALPSLPQATRVLHDEEARSLVQDLRLALEGFRLSLAVEDARSQRVASATDRGCDCGQRLAAVERAAEVLARFDASAARPSARAPPAAEGSWLGASLATRAPREDMLEAHVTLEDKSPIERSARDGCAPAELEVIDQIRAERQYWLEALQD